MRAVKVEDEPRVPVGHKRSSPPAAVMTVLLVACAGAPVPTDCYRVAFSEATTNHITNYIKAPFVVRQFEGQLAFRDSETWPRDLAVVFEVRDSSGRTFSVDVAADGTFRLPNLPAGTYCFKVSTEYTQAYQGQVTVSRFAAKGRRVVIELAVGV